MATNFPHSRKVSQFTVYHYPIIIPYGLGNQHIEVLKKMYFEERRKRESSLRVYGTGKGGMQTEQKSICVTDVSLKATRHNVQSRVILHGTPSRSDPKILVGLT
jgi:hypothetical protein